MVSMQEAHVIAADQAMEEGLCRVDRAGWDPQVAAGKADSAHRRPLVATVGENSV